MEASPLRPAAQYVRMSTEHQRYSVEGQGATNAAFALEHGLQIVRTYRDEGISGLSMKGRDGLKALLSDVVRGDAGFDVILVYDVSRWGRFQDPDQAAHYEFLCREAGVRVEYTAEPFRNDGDLVSGIVKHLKRAMAAEYSRELSVKVAAAKRGLARKGYWTGSPPAFGYARYEVCPDGGPGRRLGPGEWKSLQGRRTVLVLGPDEEVAIVRRIFREFVVDGLRILEIARRLNEEGLTKRGRLWTRCDIHRVLGNEAYAGVQVSGRNGSTLRLPRKRPPEQWIRVEGAHPAIVRRGLFDLAQLNRRTGWNKPSDAALLDELRVLLARHGRLGQKIVNDDPDTHSATVFQKRFGGLMAAYALIGYAPNAKARAAFQARMRQTRPDRAAPEPVFTDEALISGLRELLARHGRITAALVDQAAGLPCASTCKKRLGGHAEIWRLLNYEPSPRQLRGLREANSERQG